MKTFLLSLLCVASTAFAAIPRSDYDVVVYGGTPAGIMAAVEAGRNGQKVIVLDSNYVLGGMMAGGLTKTDIGKPETIGGLAREFYDRVVKHYTKLNGADSEQVKSTDEGYYFEPKVAGQIFREMLTEVGAKFMTKEELQEVKMSGQKISSIVTRNYETKQESEFGGKIFIDGTYEGDLMAGANVMYRVGREARSEYNESLAGMNAGPKEYLGSGDHRSMAYNIRGTITYNPELVVPFPKPSVYYPEASASQVSAVKANNYKTMEELFRTVFQRYAFVNGKGDPNVADFPGVTFGYQEADYEARARILKKVQDYWLSYWWRLQNDPTLPKEFLEDMKRWGVPKDEYLESNHVSPQLYVREARRMLGRYLITQKDVQEDRFKPDTICMGSYNTDCHDFQSIQTDEGLVGEGHFNGSADPWEIPYRSITPYGVPNLLVVCAVSATHVAYSSLRMEPVFMMIGHAAGEAAALAIKENVPVQKVDVAVLQAELTKQNMKLKAPFRPVVDIKVVTPPPYEPGQKIDFEVVAKQQRAPFSKIAWNFDGSGEVQATTEKASYTFPEPVDTEVLLNVEDGDGLKSTTVKLKLAVGNDPQPDPEVHYSDAKLTGRWDRTRGTEMEYRARVGLITVKGSQDSTATFSINLAESGRYRVAMAFPAANNRDAKVPITVTTADGEKQFTIDQRKKPTPFAFMPIGEFRFEKGKPAVVKVSSEGVKGYVAIDTVRWIWLGP